MRMTAVGSQLDNLILATVIINSQHLYGALRVLKCFTYIIGYESHNNCEIGSD